MEFDLERLSPPTRWIGRRLDIYAEVDSTNLVCAELADRGAPEGTLVVADRQSAGRGRLGRSFFSPGGTSLYASLLLRPDEPADQIPRYVFAAAVAVAETARERLPAGVDVQIKWPNDVLLDGRKTSGINLPAQLQGDRLVSCVLGIGINVNPVAGDFPPELVPIATSLRIAGGVALDRLEVAHAFLARLEAEIDDLRAGNHASVLDRWRAFFTMGGERVAVGGPGVAREIHGICEGVDAEGALIVRTHSGEERVLAGDVTLLEREA